MQRGAPGARSAHHVLHQLETKRLSGTRFQTVGSGRSIDPINFRRSSDPTFVGDALAAAQPQLLQRGQLPDAAQVHIAQLVAPPQVQHPQTPARRTAAGQPGHQPGRNGDDEVAWRKFRQAPALLPPLTLPLLPRAWLNCRPALAELPNQAASRCDSTSAMATESACLASGVSSARHTPGSWLQSASDSRASRRSFAAAAICPQLRLLRKVVAKGFETRCPGCDGVVTATPTLEPHQCSCVMPAEVLPAGGHMCIAQNPRHKLDPQKGTNRQPDRSTEVSSRSALGRCSSTAGLMDSVAAARRRSSACDRAAGAQGSGQP